MVLADLANTQIHQIVNHRFQINNSDNELEETFQIEAASIDRRGQIQLLVRRNIGTSNEVISWISFHAFEVWLQLNGKAVVTEQEVDIDQ